MPLDPDFVADALYDPNGLLIDEVLEINPEKSHVRVRMPTHDLLPITASQRTHDIRHPRHVSGGLMVHMTGVAAFAHFYHVLGLRHRDGWTGYGVRIHDARFLKLAPAGPPILIDCTMLKKKQLGGKILARYEFDFWQEDQKIYEGNQSALWLDTRVSDPETGAEL